VTSQTGGWQGSWREGIAANRPLIPILAKPGKAATLPAEMSFASVSAPNVLVSAIKKCEDDDSVIVRCYDIEGKNSVAQLKLFRPIASAKLANIIEDEGAALPTENGTVRISIGHHSIETIKLQINR
jgi:alpha-mannosidase